MADQRLTAIHEAGHALAHIRLHIDWDHASIVPKDDSAGHVVGNGPEHVWSKDEAEPMAIALCAGYAAMVAAGYPDSVAREGCDSDFEKTTELVDFWGLHGLGTWQCRAVDLMREPQNLAAVALVAQHLLEHGTLEMDYLDVLVDLADGKCTREEFDQFIALRAESRSHWPKRGEEKPAA